MSGPEDSNRDAGSIQRISAEDQRLNGTNREPDKACWIQGTWTETTGCDAEWPRDGRWCPWNGLYIKISVDLLLTNRAPGSASRFARHDCGSHSPMRIRCPFRALGCTWQVQRGVVCMDASRASSSSKIDSFCLFIPRAVASLIMEGGLARVP